MTDIVERLRLHVPDEFPESTQLLEDAAAEIERLKGEASVMRQLLRRSWDVIDTAGSDSDEESQMLQELLNQISEVLKARKP